MQIINLAPPPIEDKQRVELLKGVSALYYGLATPSGIVNLVTKRAGDRPITGFYVNGDVKGSYGGGVDRTLGPDGQFGINGAMYYTGQRYADALNLYSMPGYPTFGLGANYKLRLASERMLTLRIDGDNITDKRYWATGGTVFYVGLARQVRFSASVDF